MERQELTDDQAFDVLGRSSLHTITELVDVARTLTATTGHVIRPRRRWRHDCCALTKLDVTNRVQIAIVVPTMASPDT